MTFHQCVLKAATAIAICLHWTVAPCLAINGTNPLRLSTFNHWRAFEIVTMGDNISGIADSGYGTSATLTLYDGLGATLIGGSTLRVFLNHEASRASISRVELNLPAFQQAIASSIDGGVTPFPASFVTAMGYAYSSIYDGSYHAISNPSPVATGTASVVAYGNTNFKDFCSGTFYSPQSFGLSRGFADGMYITGEETASTPGHFYAINPATQALWEIPDLGIAAWENAALVDTGNTTHTALVLQSDPGIATPDYIRLYVGRKNFDANGDSSIDFLERNGLRGGSIYFFDPDGAASTTDLPDGTVTGTWQSSNSAALRDNKLEDIHTNPLNGTELVFADETDGVYRMNINLAFTGVALNTTNSTATIVQIDDDDSTSVNDPLNVLNAPDNVAWSANGKIFVQEDGSGNDMYQLNPNGSDLVRIAHALSEPSGIIDISDLVGYPAGSVLLTSVLSSTNSQLAVMVYIGATFLGDLTESFTIVPYTAAGDIEILPNSTYTLSGTPPAAGAWLITSIQAGLGFELSGEFATRNVPGGFLDLPNDPLGRRLSVLNEGRAADGTGLIDTMKIGIALPGDLDFDGDVDFDDAFALVNNYGIASGATWRDGDFNGNGTVDFDDAFDQVNFYGSTYANAGLHGDLHVATVPELSSASLLGMGLLALVRLRRRG